jgi:hypothetical protein
MMLLIRTYDTLMTAARGGKFAVQDHLVKASTEALATLMANDNLLLPGGDSVVSGAEHWSTKGQASNALRAVLAFSRSVSLRSCKPGPVVDVCDDSKVDNAVGAAGGQHGTGSS